MIPVRLELTNFFSYRETAVLDLDGIHLAGISGANGAGKSSIVEAITWALFGQSRVRSDDDLVNRQAGEEGAAEVRFTFLLGDSTYRIIRRKRPGKSTLLELQMAAGEDEWKPLSEGKIRDTQAAIEGLLRMNYETFINASFLLQGKADQFTTRTASQRKEILAELLGVTEWEGHRERAAAARKELQGSVDLLDARLAEYALEMEEEAARRQALEEAQGRHKAIVEQREARDLLLHEARVKEAALEEQRYAIAAMEKRVQRLQAATVSAQATLQERRERQGQLAAIVDQAQEITAAYGAWQTAEQQVAQFQALAQQHNALVQALQPFQLQIGREQSRLQEQQAALTAQAQRAEAARAEQATISSGISGAEEALQAVQAEREQADRLQEQLVAAQDALRRESGQRTLWQQELDKIKAEARRMDGLAAEKREAGKNKSEAEALIVDLDERAGVINDQQQTYAGLLAEKEALRTQQPTLRSEMDKLKERIETLQEAEAEGACPLCDQALSEDHRRTVLQNLSAEGKHFGDSFRENDARLKALEVELPQIQKTIQKGAPLERERQAQQKRLAAAEARLEEIARAEAAWSEDGEKRLVMLAASLADDAAFKTAAGRVEQMQEALGDRKALQEKLEALQGRIAGDKGRLTEIERLLESWKSVGEKELAAIKIKLESEAFAQEARREAAFLREELDSIGYDARLHQAAVQERDAAAEAPARFQELKEAQAALGQLTEAIGDLEARLEQEQKELAEQKSDLEETKMRLAALESVGIKLAEIQQEVNRLREEEIAAAQQVGIAQQRLNVLDDLRTLAADLVRQKDALLGRIQRLQVLERSCGRKGVQALLIEHALPEIEESANELLERLTDGEMRIKFDTQRRLKSRDAVAETLDIIISDRAGERPYDNYSGGEQFRINFAVRLALSQLLASRAGAKLQTLVVDEGFGSQDPQGRQRLVEAINAVQDDFALILVITHIEELRQAFPTRIEVIKEIGGSQIAVY